MEFFPFVAYAFAIISKNLTLTQAHKHLYLCFLKSFIILFLKCRSVIHFELSITYDVR